MILRILCFLQYVILLVIMNHFQERCFQMLEPTEVSTTQVQVSTRMTRPGRCRICTCRKYRCSCCINFSFIRRWRALGCFNIQSLPGNLNIVLSFSFNNRHLAVFPIAGSRPMPFCKRLHMGTVEACLVIYNVRTNTPHDIMVCLYMELRVGIHSVATIHLDCIRKIHRHLQFIPIPSHNRKGTVLDVHVLPNDTALTVLRQEFHWLRDTESNSDSDSEYDEQDEEEEEIKLEPRHGVFHWLKRILWWRKIED